VCRRPIRNKGGLGPAFAFHPDDLHAIECRYEDIALRPAAFVRRSVSFMMFELVEFMAHFSSK